MSTMFLSSEEAVGEGAKRPKNVAADRRLNDGVLMLASAIHSTLTSDQRAMLPAAGSGIVQLIPNIAWQQAKAVIGSGDATALSARLISNFLATDMTFERTLRRGLHGSTSRTAMQTGRSAVLTLPDAIKARKLANPRGRYMIALRGMITRKALYNGSAIPLMMMSNPAGGSGPEVNLWTMITLGDDGGVERGRTLSAELGAYPDDPFQRNQEMVPFLMMSATWRVQNTLPASISDFAALAAIWGAYAPYHTLSVNKSASWVFYDYLEEDGNLSGREWETFRRQQIEVFNEDTAVGGPLYADMVTPPATLIA